MYVCGQGVPKVFQISRIQADAHQGVRVHHMPLRTRQRRNGKLVADPTGDMTQIHYGLVVRRRVGWIVVESYGGQHNWVETPLFCQNGTDPGVVES